MAKKGKKKKADDDGDGDENEPKELPCPPHMTPEYFKQ